MRSLLLLGTALAVTPVEKVVQLLTRLEAKIEEEGKAEAVAYDKFSCFCKEQADNKLYAIENDDKKIAKLNALIESLEAEIEVLDKEVADGNAEVDRLTKESEKETQIRADERAEYERADASITQAIGATKRAIVALQESRPDASLIQQSVAFASAAGLDQSAVHRLRSLVSKQQPAAYSYHSNEIIELLQRLLKQFKARKEKLFVEESTQKHAFNKVEQARQFEIKTTNEAVAEASRRSAQKSDEKSKATDDLNTTTDDRNSDQEFLNELTAQCEQKATQFDQRSTSRAAELKALSEAQALLKGDGGSKYGANKKLNFIQHRGEEDAEEQQETDDEESSDDQQAQEEASTEDATDDESAAEDLVFLQTASVKNTRVFNYLREEATRLKSTALTALTMKLKADHFVKVRQLIKDLISRLEAQAEAEQTHKDMCDREMKEATTKRDESQTSMESERAAITNNKATIKELTQDIAMLKEKIAESKKSLRERTELRNEERAENEKTIADAEAGAAAIRDAVKTLKNYYDTPAFLQLRKIHKQEPYKAPKSDREGNTVADLAPETFDNEDYRGDQESSKGIFGLLNVIRSDYERTISETQDLEKVAQDEFDQFEQETNDKIAEYEGEVETKDKAKADEKDALMQNEDDLNDATKKNENAHKKLAVLKADCVDGAVSHEERLKRREQEVESLKEALNILEEMNFLQKK